MIKNKLRVLVVDDTVVYRKIVSDVLSELPDVEVVGVAHNGKIAIAKIKALKPDLLTLDIEMPEVNGLEVLKYLQKSTSGTGAVMLSTLTSKGGDMTMQALELGAFDFIPKPQSGTMADNKKAVKDALEPMVKAFADRKSVKNILSGVTRKGLVRTGENTVKRSATGAGTKRQKSEIIGIGISTGGPNALAAMMPGIPSNIGVPILIVQHMPPVFTKSLAKSLNSRCAIEVREAVNGEPLIPNTALIAPGGKQMKIVAGADGKRRVIKITDDPPENSCKPSVDYLFRSIAYHYVGRATGVIMTGMGSDGTTGLKLMKRNGATIIAQDEASCVVYGMPKAPAEAGIVDTVAPLDKIAAAITGTV
ncbi:MAG: chemotaxis response regulator protein-glutamate methylesterase [Deltaproteobacteria bacterium]|nr:chemotaxis response regulator protein-glutamate methylesterase [Deltaproteobacteria bacterium]